LRLKKNYFFKAQIILHEIIFYSLQKNCANYSVYYTFIQIQACAKNVLAA